MPGLYLPLFSPSFLEAVWRTDRRIYDDAVMLARLKAWDARPRASEAQDEAAFIKTFFADTWDYRLTGTATDGHECTQQYSIPGAGAGGGTGRADLALGFFGCRDVAPVPQVLCEFKGVSAGLDEPQRRKGDQRSPVKQCADYIREALKPLYGTEAVLPRWGIVTDMNEFRLYWWNRMPAQYQRFTLRPAEGSGEVSLLEETDGGALHRFLFWRMFRPDMLLTRGGTPALVDLITRQGERAKAIEEAFYGEYADYRLTLYNAIQAHNADRAFTETQLLRMAQKVLDRCIFTLFCEDMGVRVKFPPGLLKDFLVHICGDPIFTSGGNEVWQRLSRLFAAMNDGTVFFRKEIRRFNGGLFAADPVLDGLHIPNHAFCRMGGRDKAEDHPGTLLWFSLSYDFGIRNDGERSITLYTLGRIFEQSVRDVEEGVEGLRLSAEARAVRRASSRRKREGVYYTPEWVVQTIVEETVALRLAELRREFGCDGPAPRNGPERRAWLAALEAYAARLDRFTVLDPSCGSGAFLIHATEVLLAERERVLRTLGRWEDRLLAATDHVDRVLTRNIYGVDINPAAVEIAQLSVWLHTIQPDFPLSHLEANVLRGNSLVGPDLWERPEAAGLPADRREAVAAFDWNAAFPDVMAHGGFDCIVGNPPYVKLQNYKPHHPETVAHLTGWGAPETAPYASTVTGNMDVYLPFVEKGLALLGPGGRMGLIAPNVWLVAEYGEGLRALVHRTRQLERWVDFKSFQVFEEVTTYTALQFFTREPQETLRFVPAPDGAVAALDWTVGDRAIPYDELPGAAPWVLAPEPERRLMAGLAARCRPLGDPAVTRHVFVGVQTSADWIYHLERLGPGEYRCRPPGEAPLTVEIEDAVMRPLVSGTDVKRYAAPDPTTRILFPYDGPGGGALYDQDTLRSRFPKAWDHLRRHRAVLEARERGAFRDDRWYRFGRHQNIDKQHLPKLLVPRLALTLHGAVDRDGAVCLDNVDCGGIIPANEWTLDAAIAVLNSPIANYVWRRIAKPFQNDYRSANRQYISPLPMPNLDQSDHEYVVSAARSLQALHTERLGLSKSLDRRLDGLPSEERAETWLFFGLPDVKDIEKRSRAHMSPGERRAWAKEVHRQALADRIATLDAELAKGGRLEAALTDGELSVRRNGKPILDRVFVDPDDGPILHAQWRRVCQGIGNASRIGAAALARDLRRVRSFGSAEHRRQVVASAERIAETEDRIVALEGALNERLYRLYGLSDSERALIERDGWTPFG